MNRLRQREIIRTTLGDLIAAVTDEVTAAFGDSPTTTFVVVSYIVADLLIHHRLPAQRRSVRAVV
jgi:phenylpyruvate tautomerase PptA (4-oxalocrotonate tautomerase family)